MSVSVECFSNGLSDKKWLADQFLQVLADFKLYGYWVSCSCTDEALELEGVTPDKPHAEFLTLEVYLLVFQGKNPPSTSKEEGDF